jgi:LysM repeat protein
MTDPPQEPPPELAPEYPDVRCTNCDSVLPAGADRCPMCGHRARPSDEEVPETEGLSESADQSEEVPGESGSIAGASMGVVEHDLADSPAIVESVLYERQSWATIWLTAAFVVVIVVAGLLIIQSPPPIALAVFPTETPIPPTSTYTPTWTPLPSETSLPLNTPTATSTAAPSATPRPPRTHSVSSGETLFGLGLRYGVTADSIADVNELPPGSGIQVSQQLVIPWPTATPPLVPVEIDVGGETIVADPTDCELYEIKGGDTFFGIAARQRIDLGALVAVNRLTDQSILQPGDRICIPKIIRGGVLPPTPGPSPTPTATRPPPGPYLLYPVLGAVIEPPNEPPVLQWAAVKNLTEEEWYMVELTDLTNVDSHPRRGFTRQTSFRIPSSWRPVTPESHLMRWRVTIVRVSGQRADGTFIYEFSGQSSQDAFFTWLGAIPTPTPTWTPTPTAEHVN